MFSSMKLSPSTQMGKEEAKKIRTIIQSILDKPESYDFQNPVDWKTLGLTDYTFIIKNPMDLGTVREKLQDERYRFVEQALDDIQLIWDNCKSYNHPDTWISKTAENMERLFKKMVKNYLPSIPITVPGRQPGSGRNDQRKPIHNNLFEEEENDDEVPYHDKLKLQEKLKHLTPEAMKQVVDYIMQKSPQAFWEEGENAQILIDNLDCFTFLEVSGMVSQLNQEFEEHQLLSKKIKQ